MTRNRTLRVEFWYDADCPNAPTARQRLQQALAQTSGPWVVFEHVDAGRLSPTLLVDGAEVGSEELVRGCRRDLPDVELIRESLHRAADRPAVLVARRLGPLGQVARLATGLAFIAAALGWADASWWDVGLAVVVLPLTAVATAVLVDVLLPGATTRTSARRPWSSLQVLVAMVILTVVVGVAVLATFVSPADGAGGALLFLGGSMLLAVGRGYDGCEVLAVPNLVLGRRDSMWCPLYAPLDVIERRPPEIRRNKTAAARTLGPSARQVHRRVLLHAVESGRLPERSVFAQYAVASGVDAEPLRRKLVAADVMAFDQSGNVVAAYPFSAVPTGVRVTTRDGVSAHAMCALDALGVSSMLGRPVEVAADEPCPDRHEITVHVDGRRATWSPRDAVVFLAGADDDCCPSVEVTCPSTRFFTSEAAARQWATDHPSVPGRILGQDEAMGLAVAEFGGLLGAPEAPS